MKIKNIEEKSNKLVKIKKHIKHVIINFLPLNQITSTVVRLNKNFLSEVNSLSKIKNLRIDLKELENIDLEKKGETLKLIEKYEEEENQICFVYDVLKFLFNKKYFKEHTLDHGELEMNLVIILKEFLNEINYKKNQNNFKIPIEKIILHQKIILSNLENLYLYENNFHDEDILHLKKLEMSNLKSLDLNGNNLTKEGIVNLSHLNLQKIIKLSLDNNLLGDQGLIELSKIKFNNLNHLDLQGNKISDEGITFLIDFNFSNLTHLFLSENLISDSGVSTIAWLNLEKLTHLDLSDNLLTNKCEEYFHKMKNSKLTYLALNGNEINNEEKYRIKNKFNLTYNLVWQIFILFI